MFQAYAQIEPLGGWPGWLRAFLDLGWAPKPQEEWLIVFVDPSPVLVSTASNGWANAFVSDGSPYDRFGYNIDDDRWAYNLRPRDSARIQQAIRAFNAKHARL
jgi:hypothetical protein